MCTWHELSSSLRLRAPSPSRVSQPCVAVSQNHGHTVPKPSLLGLRTHWQGTATSGFRVLSASCSSWLLFLYGLNFTPPPPRPTRDAGWAFGLKLQQREASSPWVMHEDGTFILFDCFWNANNKRQCEQCIKIFPKTARELISLGSPVEEQGLHRAVLRQEPSLLR